MYILGLIPAVLGFQRAPSILGLVIGFLGAAIATLGAMGTLMECPLAPKSAGDKVGFVLPGNAFVPLLGILVCEFMFIENVRGSFLWPILAWVAAGVVLYFAYGLNHSTLEPERSVL